jgi:predicted cupin superfamily sugar epimerase
MGPDVRAGDQPQVLVPAGVWQGAALDRSSSRREGFSLVSCVVSPPWDELDFTLGERAELIRQFPADAELICRLTR